MYLVDNTITTDQLQDAIAQSPFSKSAIATYLQVYSSSRKFLDGQIFRQLKANIESLTTSPLDLRKRLERARFGRYLTWAELTYQQALPNSLEPLYLLEEAEQPAEESQQLKEQRDQARSDAESYRRQLEEYEAFCRFLLIGKILYNPKETNGMEKTPLMQVFNEPLTLNDLAREKRELLKRHHPDVSQLPSSQAEDVFNWIKNAFTVISQNWHKFDPFSDEVGRDRVDKLMNQQLNYSLETLRYWEQ